MGERRKRRSLWDMEEETRHFSGISGHNSWTGKDRHSSHDSGRYPELSESRPTIPRKSRGHSGWPSWESIEEIPVAPMNGSFRNTRDGREMGAGKRYYENMSPGFDGMEGHTYTHDFDQSHSYRYQGSGRSRSRSRSRIRGRSRSRSLSKGRRRGRSWSSSRSRSRSDGNAKDQSRSRSPMGDYGHHSYGWSERRSSPEKPSQICREFSAGRCRRGSQCRFFHPNSLSHGDWELMEDDKAEIWRSRADLSCFPKHSYRRGSGFESRNDVSDPYYAEDERFLNKNRSAVPCKDFMRGRCRWGDACRFLHHASDDSISRGTRNADRQPYKNGKPFCKFFAAGKCDRDNCRFSHDDRNLNNLEGRLGEATDSGSALDRNNLWNGSTWDDAKPTGWDKTIVSTTTVTGDTGNGQSDNRGGSSLENEEKNLGIFERVASSPQNNEIQPSFVGDGSSYGRDTGPTESISKENMDNKQEHFILPGSWPQNQDRIANLHEQNVLLENRSVSIESLQQNTYPASHIQEQLDRITVNNINNSSGSDALVEVKDARYTSHPILLSEQSLNQNSGSMFPGHSSISDESDRVQNILSPNPSNGFSTDLNVPETHFGHLNLPDQWQDNQKVVQSPGLLEAKVQQILPNWLTSDHSARVTSSLVSADGQWDSPATNPVSLTQRHEHYQSYSGAEAGNSTGMVPSLPDTSGYVHLANTTNAQENPGAVSLDLFSSARNGRGNAEHSNHNFAQGMVHNNQMQLEQPSPLSLTAREFEGSKVKHPESPRLRKEVANSEVTEGNKAVAEESKDVQEDKKTETLDGQRKVEEGSGKKDEKGMRMFKISLVEFVKEILKPTWKEGRMSREVHKTVVKKVVDKVSSTIQVDHIPRTQDKVHQYLSYSKPKITKLVQAYVERSLKAGSRS